MGSGADPVGKRLAESGLLDEASIADVLARQQRALPFASLCYALGYADEEPLARALADQLEMPAVVLDRSVLRPRLSGGAAREILASNNLVCLDEDERHLHIAADDPVSMRAVFHELEFMKGKIVVPYVALHITLARTSRTIQRALDRGDELCLGVHAGAGASAPYIHVLGKRQTSVSDPARESAHEMVFSDVTSGVRYDDLMMIDQDFEGPETERGVDAAGTDRIAAEASPDGLERSIALYRSGAIDAAMAELRQCLHSDPGSARHHFVLANLLQRQSQIVEAIDEYEATIACKPTYFPALTRLAYLYYKQGYSAKAIEIWSRSLPHCPDPGLRTNIELFMRKLIAELAPDLAR